LGIIYRKGKELSSTALRFVELLRRQNGTEGAGSAVDELPARAASGSNGEPRNGKHPAASTVKSSPA
jgi:hypothetical protein